VTPCSVRSNPAWRNAPPSCSAWCRRWRRFPTAYHKYKKNTIWNIRTRDPLFL
jgi:hypothetical protein